MDLSHWLWVATAAYALHATEEFMLDWRDWARAAIGIPVEWEDFYVVNFVVVVLGVCAANLAAAAPAIALSFAALMLINGIIFHIAQVIRMRGRFSPGVITAVILLLPVGIACYCAAGRAGVLTPSVIAISFLIGALLMAMPIVLLKIRGRPYFRQS